jgi:hypothetical protein
MGVGVQTLPCRCRFPSSAHILHGFHGRNLRLRENAEAIATPTNGTNRHRAPLWQSVPQDAGDGFAAIGDKPMRDHMNLPILVLAFTMAMPTFVAAEGEGHLGTPQQQRACRVDVARHCADVEGKTDQAIAECLAANKAKLSRACRRVFEEGRR